MFTSIAQSAAETAALRESCADALVNAWISPGTPDVIKVGKEGYVHGWICVRPPCGKPGDKITHPDMGNGQIVGNFGGKLHASFGGKTVVLGNENKHTTRPATEAPKPRPAWKVKRPSDAVPDTSTFRASELTIDGGRKAIPPELYDHGMLRIPTNLPVEDEGKRFTYRDADGNVAGFAESHGKGAWDVYNASGKKIKDDEFSRVHNHINAANKLADEQKKTARKARAKLGIEDAVTKRDRLLKNWKTQVKPTAAEKRAIYQYQDESQALNNALRGVKSEINMADKDAREWARKLDAVASRYSLPEPVTAYRGAMLRMPDNPVGKVITDNGIVSTSLDQNTAHAFIRDVYESEDKEAVPAMFRISIPAGAHGIFQPPAPGEDDQTEFMLPTGSRFQITHVTSESDHTLYDVTLV